MIVINNNGIAISVIDKDVLTYNVIMEEYKRCTEEITSLANKAEAAKTDLEYNRYADELTQAEDEFRGFRKALTMLGFEIDKPYNPESKGNK